MAEFDYKEYARQLRENAVKDDNGVIRCSPELWEQIANVIESIPTADVAEVRHGCWEDRPNPQWKAYDIRHCSKCGWNIPKNNLRKKDLNWNYCPECGARMDGDDGETV